MKTVFIGGSRNVRVLDEDVRRRLDRVTQQRLAVVIGDANGADKAVQDYLHQRGYAAVSVFCMDGRCRNNVGQWPLRVVVSRRRRKDFQYYATKDRLMAQEADAGLMIWDGCSVGSLANVGRLARQDKTVLVHLMANGQTVRITREADWQHLLAACPAAARARVEEELRIEEGEPVSRSEASLF